MKNVDTPATNSRTSKSRTRTGLRKTTMSTNRERIPPSGRPPACGICGYEAELPEPSAAEASQSRRSETHQSSTTDSQLECPVCLNGEVDPWSMIREIREVAGSLVAQASLEQRRQPQVDPFGTEWDLLEPSVRSIWADLTDADLGKVNGSRQSFEDVLRSRYGYGKSLARELTDGVRDLHDRFNGHWDIVKPCVRRRWGQLGRREIDSLGGTITELAGLIERRYALPPGDGRRQVTEFLNRIDFALLVRLFGNGKGDQMGEGEATLLLQERLEAAAS